MGESNDHGVISSSKDHTANHTKESECHVNEIVEISRTKARSMVDMAIQVRNALLLSYIPFSSQHMTFSGVFG